MPAGVIALLIVGGLVVIAALWVVLTYNGLIRLRNRVENAWSQIDVQLKRRHDLIPNLVETAKGYMEHERETLEAVTEARNLARQASGPGEAAEAEQELSNALGQFFLVVEQYPDLKANQNFLSLQEELTSTENKIGFARQFYNDETMAYNNRVQSFPANVVANTFGFGERDFFELELEEERAVPEVEF
ncbi:MAG: LemA family protein [Planctomycetota bacterium]